MKHFFKMQTIILATIMTVGLYGCSSSSQDDASLEAQEPVDAEPQLAEQNPPAGSEQTAADAAPASEPASEAAPVTPPASESPGSGTVMNTARRVMYVSVDNAVMREKPEQKSKIVGKASKGDHFLVAIEGDWAKLDSGVYMSVKVLSEKAVGRPKKEAAWAQGAAELPAKLPGKPKAKLPAKPGAVGAKTMPSDVKAKEQIAPPAEKSSAPIQTEKQKADVPAESGAKE
jgi:hypothetical protein